MGVVMGGYCILFAGTWLQKRTASQILLLPFYLAKNSLIHRYVLCMYCVRVVPLVFEGSTSSPIPRRLLHMVGSLGIGMWHYYGHVLSQPLLTSFLPVSPSHTHPHSFVLSFPLSLSPPSLTSLSSLKNTHRLFQRQDFLAGKRHLS